MPNLEDYLINQAGKDWPELLSGWSPPLPESCSIWLVNRLGDVFAVLEDDSVHMLDVGVGTFTRLADNREDFRTRIDLDDYANDWLMIPLVDRCVSAGMVLVDNQCYGYKLPPLFGGKYDVENLYPADLSAHYSFLADIFRQTRDLPDGTRIRLVLAPEPHAN
jgi:hypothetical protein